MNTLPLYMAVAAARVALTMGTCYTQTGMMRGYGPGMMRG